MRGEPTKSPIGALVEALASGAVEIVDLTQPLNERTPVIRITEKFVDTPGLKRHEISRYDERGPAWAWYWLEIGEYVGTHLTHPYTGSPAAKAGTYRRCHPGTSWRLRS